MPCLFFSGGIDSTVLAFDVATRPYAYGVCEEYKTLHLVHSGKPPRGRKNSDLKALLKALRAVSELEITFRAIEDGLSYDPGTSVPPVGGPESLSPILHRNVKDLSVIPYTPGWMFWMTAVGVNLLAGAEGANPEQVFIAHQWNAPVWRALDAGENLPYDCLPEFFVHANRAIEASNERVVLRTPFLDNRLDRLAIVRLGVERGVPFEYTSSCVCGWGKDCGLCGVCILRHASFKTVGLESTGRKKRR